MVCEVGDVRISQLRSLLRASDLGTHGGRCNHITFVQVYIASLALARFNAGCEKSAFEEK